MVPHPPHQDAVDVFKLLAALAVATLHVEMYPGLQHEAAVQVRLACRWAVPFFFLLTGYYLGAREGSLMQRGSAQISRVLWIFLFASLLYVPLVLLRSGLKLGLPQILVPSVLVYGTQVHLWFLSSMLFGLLLLQSLYRFGMQAAVLPIGAVILLLALLTGTYQGTLWPPDPSGQAFAFARQLTSITFIGIGMALGRRRAPLSMGAGVALAVGGIALQGLEVYLLRSNGSNPLHPELLLGTTPFAIGMLAIALALGPRRFGPLARWGRDQSLGIYIVHIWWLFVLERSRMRWGGDWQWPAPLLPLALAFGLSLLSLLTLERIAPRLKRLLDGRLDQAAGTVAQRAA